MVLSARKSSNWLLSSSNTVEELDPQPIKILGQLSYEMRFLFREEEFGVNWVRQDIVNEERRQEAKGWGWIPNESPKPGFISLSPSLGKYGGS